MNLIIEALTKAINLILTGDPTLTSITLRSLVVSGLATILASLWSLPTASLIALKNFRGKMVVKGLINALMGIPTVALGLLLYLTFSKEGILGYLNLLYTPTVIIIGQSILITPILTSFLIEGLESIQSEISMLAKTLGADQWQTIQTTLSEAKNTLALSHLAAFNRAIAELGVALMVGGNIRGTTRVLTTTIALETARGEIALSIALAIILLTLVILLNLTIRILEGKQ